MQSQFKMKIFDISLLLNEQTITYPGTTALKITPTRSSVTGSALSEITLSSHAGTHIDAPAHVIEGGKTIDQIKLDIFFGPCRVLDLTQVKDGILVKDLEGKNIKEGERILLKTNNSKRGFDKFYEDYVYLSSEGAEYLADLGVKLVGIDCLSIKKRGLSDNRAHSELLSKNISIIEGLNMANIEEGKYTLVAFPLKFTGIDGSPARIVLIR